jgi:hypothetical protein
MTKIFKILLALCVLWFVVPYFYHYYLDNQVFRKIEKEYCEKDAGLMVFVDKIDFSQPTVLRYKDISPDTDFKIGHEHFREIRKISGIFFNIQMALKKEKMYIQFDNIYGFRIGDLINIYKQKLDVSKENYLLNGVPITSTVFISTLPIKCLAKNVCTSDDLKIEYAKLPTFGLRVEYSSWSKEKVIFHDYVVETNDIFKAFNISNNQLIFSLKKYGYGGGVGYAETYDPYKRPFMSVDETSFLHLQECTGSSNKQAIKPSENLFTDLIYLREHYGN